MLSMLPDDSKAELAMYVRQAKGSLTLDEFSEKSGISKYHLSRLMNGKIKNVPRESTIIAIANNSERPSVRRFLKMCFLSNETYERETKIDPLLQSIENSSLYTIDEANQFYRANDEITPYEIKKRPSHTRYNKKNIQRPNGIIMDSLLALSFEWTRKIIPSPVNFFIDAYFCIEFSELAPFRRWHFFVLSEHPYDYQTYLYSTLGIIINLSPPNDEKYTIVLDSNRRYHQAKIARRDVTHSNISVLLINSNTKILEMYMNLEKSLTFEELKSIRLK